MTCFAAPAIRTASTIAGCVRKFLEKIRCAAGAANVFTSANPTIQKGGRQMLSKEDLQYFKELLTSQLEELQRKAGGTVSDLLLLSVYSADPLDTSAMDVDRSFTLRIRDRESKLINKIKAALDRIEEGEFGECEMCGEDIGLARLRARPVTTYCIRCKTKLESQEKLVSGF
jgi:DnaK suppressor protein